MTDYLDLKFFLDPMQHGYYGTFVMGDGDAILDDWIGTAITVSFGTNLRVDGEDRPDNGWWGEVLVGNFGSKLYLLDRSKAINENLRLAEQYAIESLQWLVDEGHILEVSSATATYDTNYRVQIVTVYKTLSGDVRKHQHIFSLSEGA